MIRYMFFNSMHNCLSFTTWQYELSILKFSEEFYQKHDMECAMSTLCSGRENAKNSMNIAKNNFLSLAIF